MLRKLLIALFLVAPSAFAQSNVQISLGVTYAGGSLTIQRLPAQGGLVETRHTFLGANGDTFINYLVPGSMYGFRAVTSSNTGQLYAELLVNGSPQDLSAALLASPSGQNILPANNNFTGNNTACQLNNVIVVDGSCGFTQNAAGIQAALNAAPPGGEVYLPAVYPGNNGYPFGVSDSCITITKPVTLHGPNLHSPASNGANILVASGVGATTDIICVAPTTDGDGIRLADFSIVPQSGTPARYGVHVNSPGVDVTRFSMERVEILQLGSSALYMEGSGATQGVPAQGYFTHNVFVGGVQCINCGDAVVFAQNVITGIGNMNFAWQSGASTLILHDNYIAHLSGGIHIGANAVAPIIEDNEIEMHGNTGACTGGTVDTGSNGAALDIDGTSGSIAQAVDIFHNSFQIVCGSTLNAIRINWANNTSVRDNRLGIGATNAGGGPPFGIITTANPTKTHLRPNNFYDSAGATATIALSVSDGAPVGANGTLIEFGGNTQSDKPLIYRASDLTDTIWGYNGQIFGIGNNGNNQIYNGFNNNPAATFNVLGVIGVGNFTTSAAAPCTNGELALSAGWQSTGSATVTAVAGNGQTCSWTITTGTTTAANPTVTDTLTNQLQVATTRCWMFLEYGPASTHTAAAGEGFAQTTLSATAPVFTFNGTPTAAGKTYLIVRTCGP